MKIRNLLVMGITIALGTLCAAAQDLDGSMTFTDNLNQSITISRYGAVLSFKNSKGLENATNDAFRICTTDSKCIESAIAPTEGTSAELKIKLPEQGVTIEMGQRLVVTATVRGADLTVTRKLEWLAGSSVVNVDETIAVSSATTISSFIEGGEHFLSLDKPCPVPPGGVCPFGTRSKWKVQPGKIELTKQLSINPRQPLRARIKYDFSTWR
ncbi:MAG: hypothetical protein ACREBG_28465 [Pyrinomonadaceae bacterium]